MRIAGYHNYCNLILVYSNDGLHEWQKRRDQADVKSYFHECHKYTW
jgi:hypothetical protein